MYSDSLWGEEFNVQDSKQKTKDIIKKTKTPKVVKELDTEKALKSKKVSVEDKIKLITEKVYNTLGKQVDNVLTIKTRQEFTDYITEAIKSGVIAVDTETDNSLDPVTCKLMGLCLYYPNGKQAYIPINHIDFKTRERLSWQLTEKDCKEELQRVIEDKTLILMHNGKFDYQVIKCTCDIEIKPSWDTLIASRLINENEKAGLKTQYITHIDSEQMKYDIEDLFEGQDYDIFPPDVFALYAATDALMTYKVYEYQKPIMESKDYEKIYKLFKEVEVPCIIVTAEMELNGVEVDLDYAQRLSAKYHKQLEDIDEEVAKELQTLKSKIDAWRLTPEANERPKKKTGDGVGKSKSEQLGNPVNLASPTQLAILFYDVLKVPQVNFKSPRATGEDDLKAILRYQDIKLCNLILKRRECVKLLSTYIDNIPELAKIWDDHRLRSHFNQYGTDTGRFSSGGDIKYRDKEGVRHEVSGINYQNIPSHNKEIRMLFKAKDGYVLVGSDFSQQEPRLLSDLSKDNGMITAYQEGKDLYATIAMGVYHNQYWDNMEHHEDGSPNPDGKKRRGNCKKVLLGIMYGLGVPNLAEGMGISIKEAQQVMDDFYKAFPSVKNWQDSTKEFARKYGYVEDKWGRRRRLPNISLPTFSFEDINPVIEDTVFNPFIICENKQLESYKLKNFKRKISECEKKAEINEVINTAREQGIIITDNRSKLNHAENQCVNARIQGSAATMTKKAMIKLYNDEELNNLGFKMLIGVHDELIGECPKENQDAVAERLTYIMKTVVKDEVCVPFKCDADICDHWYYNDYSDIVRKEYNEYKKMGLGDDALYQIYKDHTEMTHEQLDKILVD